MIGRKLRAPADDGGILYEPDSKRIDLILKKAGSFDLPGRPFAGLTLAEFRRQARTEVLARVCELNPGIDLTNGGHWLVAGHQPELFHPGVWLKNFALARFARHPSYRGWVTLNLIVDNDVPKAAAVRVPAWHPGIAPADVQVTAVPFDLSPVADVPFERWTCRDVNLFRSFPDRLREATRDWPFPIIGLNHWTPGETVGASVVAARQAVEAEWDFRNPELPVSALCGTAAFRAFAESIWSRADEFRDIHNSALHEYRERYRIRSRHHPVAELTGAGRAVETPFWTWTEDKPQRQRVFRESPGSPLPALIRPRALTLTLFARIVLADVFVHGIGGGKYDELTDSIAFAFFGAAPPPYVVLTGTRRLPLPAFLAEEGDRSLRVLRDATWNPQRDLPGHPLTLERMKLIALPQTTKRERKTRTQLLHANLTAFESVAGPLRDEARRRWDESQLRRSANAVLGSREYAWPLYSADVLKGWLTGRS
ncbi:MAG: hypothetical protein K1X57_11295 [Gemmataceae bacterium]|nr:hypothetical protein [Gemmataceae bacterium]